jgi:uncharacterized membrane protein
MTYVESVTTFNRPTIRINTPLKPRLALVAATISAGLSAGLFYAYQVSLIRGLAVVDDVTYVNTFQAINEKIRNPWFFASFICTPALIAAALVLKRRSSKAVKALIGAGLVLNLALLGITIFGNVPLNDDLASYDTVDTETATVARADFENRWNRLHLLRTLAAVGSFVALTGATVLDPDDRRRTGS